MTPSPSRRLFVIRMWQEADAVTATIQWRGSVQDGYSQECHYFTRRADLLAFIAARSESTAEKPLVAPQVAESADSAKAPPIA